MLKNLNPYALSGLLNILTFLPLGLFTLMHGRQRLARYFSFHVFCIAVWGICAFLIGILADLNWIALMWKIGYCFVLFIPVFLFHTISFMTHRSSSWSIKFSYGQAILFAILTLAGLMFPSMKYMFNSLYYVQGTYLYVLSFGIWLGIFGYGHVLLVQHYTHSAQPNRNIIVSILAIPFGVGAGLTNFLPALGINFYPVGNFLIPIYSIIVAYAIFQYQFLEISYVLRKGIIYTVLLSIISLIYFLFIVLLEPLLHTFLGKNVPWEGILAAFILGVIFIPLRVKIEYMVDRTFFRKSHQEILKQNELLRHELMRSEKFKLVSNIARGIVYEVRNPLTAIRALSQHIHKKPEDKKFVEESALTIDRQVERIDHLLEQLLKFATHTNPELKQVNIKSVIEDVLNIFRRELMDKKIQIQENVNLSEHKTIAIDPIQLRQAVYNVVANAVEAMPQGGTLTISAFLKPFSEVIQQNFDPEIQEFLEIKIADTGVGIPPENIPFIFDPFFSPGEKRVGLGLSIAHKITQDHNGHILVESEVNKGSTFIIELPLKNKHAF